MILQLSAFRMVTCLTYTLWKYMILKKVIAFKCFGHIYVGFLNVFVCKIQYLSFTKTNERNRISLRGHMEAKWTAVFLNTFLYSLKLLFQSWAFNIDLVSTSKFSRTFILISSKLLKSTLWSSDCSYN